MARQVLPIVGAVIGGYFGGPAGAQAGFAIGSLIGNAVDPVEIQGNKVGDSPVQTAAEGGARAIVFGKGCIRSTCVLERGNRRVVKKRDQAGKGGGPVTINERALWTFTIGLGEALPGGVILRIWENEKLVYDVTPGSTIPEDTIEFRNRFRFYDGSEDQLPDPAEEAIHGVGNASYYRGTARCVFPNFDLTDYGETVPTYRWEVAVSASTQSVNALMLFDPSLTYSSAIPSPDGFDWDASPYPNTTVPSLSHIIAGPDRYLGHVSGGSFKPWVTTDQGLNWTQSTGPTVTPRGEGIYVDAANVRGFFIPCDQGIAKTSASGLAYELWSGPSMQHIAGDGNLILAYGTNGYFYNVKLGLLEQNGPLGLVVSAGTDFLLHQGVYFYVGRYNSPNRPALRTTSNGWETGDIPLPYSTATVATHIAGGWLADGRACKVIGTDSGEVYYQIQGSNFVRASWTTYGACLGIEFVGNGFVLLSFNGSTFNNKVQFFDGVEVVDRPTAVGGRTRSAASYPTNDVSIGNPVALSHVVSQLHFRAGHTIEDFSVTELTDILAGVVIQNSTTAAEAIKSIVANYFADPVEYDGRIRYIKRGKPVVRTLVGDLTDECDLIDEPEDERRNNGIEYPRKLHLFFESSQANYATTKATSARYSDDIAVLGEGSLVTPVTFDTGTEPYGIAIKLHKVAWTEAGGEIEWHLTDEHIDLVPTDCVGLSYRGQLRRARILTIEHDPGVVKVRMVIDRQSAYTANLTEIPEPPTPTPPQSTIMAPTALAVLDISGLTDNADDMGYYVAMAGTNDRWTGATLQRSLDLGDSFMSVVPTTLNAIMGALVEVLPAASRHYTDTTNRIVVKLYSDDEIESLSNATFVAEGGAIAVAHATEDGTQWEVLQYRDAVKNLDGNWVLTTLHRGLVNTEVVEHPAGSMFVLLDVALLRVGSQSSWVDTDLMHRGVSNGLSPESASQDLMTYQGNAQREWTVSQVFLTHTGNDLNVQVVPRHRFGTDARPVRSANWQGYAIVVSDGTNETTLTTLSDTSTFDVTGWASPIEVSVAQINRFTGPGPVVTKEVA